MGLGLKPIETHVLHMNSWQRRLQVGSKGGFLAGGVPKFRKAENHIFDTFHVKTKEKPRLTTSFLAAACPGGREGG